MALEQMQNEWNFLIRRFKADKYLYNFEYNKEIMLDMFYELQVNILWAESSLTFKNVNNILNVTNTLNSCKEN